MPSESLFLLFSIFGFYTIFAYKCSLSDASISLVVLANQTRMFGAGIFTNSFPRRKNTVPEHIACFYCMWKWDSTQTTWVWVNTYRYIFSGMNIRLPAILGFTRYQGFDPSPHPKHPNIWPEDHFVVHQGQLKLLEHSTNNTCVCVFVRNPSGWLRL